MKVRFKKLNPEATLPSYAKEGDAGLDLTVTDDGAITSSDQEGFWYLEYGTGISAEIPQGYVGLVFPRSSISKKALMLSNAVGVIDSGYRGEIKARFKVDGVMAVLADKDQVGSLAKFKKGERALQLIILPYPTIEVEEADELSETERGSGGFGSSGA